MSCRDRRGGRAGSPPESNDGFTLIELLLAVSILAVSLVGVLGGYREILGTYGRARLLIEGLNLLEEKMTDRELEIRGGMEAVGRLTGEEGSWSWSTESEAARQEGWYEIKGEIRGSRRTGAITLRNYVRGGSKD